MPTSIPILFLATVFFLFSSAFFSGLEAAYLALDRVAINRLEKSGHFLARLVIYFSKKINYFLISLLTFNLFNNIMATLLASQLAEPFFRKGMEHWLGKSSLEVQTFFFDVFFIIIFTTVLLLFSELVPKKIAIKHPRFVALVGTLPMSLIYFSFLPVFYGVSEIFRWFSRSSTIEQKKQSKGFQSTNLFKREELMGYVNRISQSENFQMIEGSLLKNIIQYMNTPISSLALTREKMQGLDLSRVNGQNLFLQIKDFPNPYIVLYDQNEDNIKGVVTKKKLIYYLLENEKNGKSRVKYYITKEDLLKQKSSPIMIPESRNVLAVLQDIYYSKSDVAFITDEHGGVEGIVSQNEIISKVFENFSDDEEKLIQRINEGDQFYYIVKADTLLTAFNEYFKVNVYCEENETVGGYLLERIRNIPKKGFIYRDEWFSYRVRSCTLKKIVSLEIKKL